MLERLRPSRRLEKLSKAQESNYDQAVRQAGVEIMKTLRAISGHLRRYESLRDVHEAVDRGVLNPYLATRIASLIFFFYQVPHYILEVATGDVLVAVPIKEDEVLLFEFDPHKGFRRITGVMRGE